MSPSESYAPPRLRLPFPKGSVVLCMQGNNSPNHLSHSKPNCLYALDLVGLDETVVAAADGTTVQTFEGAQSGDKDAGYGFGNFVKLDHGFGFHTFYAHLKEVLVVPGQKLACGEKLGTVGASGWAGRPHLHFSLHQGPYSVPGVGESLPMKILAADMDQPVIFSYISSESFLGSGAIFNLSGHLYGSENSLSATPLVGEPSDSFSETLKREAERLRRYVQKNEQTFR